mmetsp:Transcript_26430/g.84056  ORF Transcript_26430/g.84056 Transcript_26430/m.84056 type:complete len:250 (+) Transcript_26430:104-853(+)
MTGTGSTCLVGAGAAASGDGGLAAGSVAALARTTRADALFASIEVAAPEVAAARRDLGALLARLLPGGSLRLAGAADVANELSSELLLAGFVDQAESDGAVICRKPGYAADAAPLKLGGNTQDKKQAWKLMADNFDDNNDVEDDDALLNEEDRAAPAAPADCGPANGGKKRACKNCSCGLKELEEAEAAGIEKVVTQPASACGNCAKGDAFRCASCPYLGTPAFDPSAKPEIKINEDGSKVLLSLDSDI